MAIATDSSTGGLFPMEDEFEEQDVSDEDDDDDDGDREDAFFFS